MWRRITAAAPCPDRLTSQGAAGKYARGRYLHQPVHSQDEGDVIGGKPHRLQNDGQRQHAACRDPCRTHAGRCGRHPERKNVKSQWPRYIPRRGEAAEEPHSQDGDDLDEVQGVIIQLRNEDGGHTLE